MSRLADWVAALGVDDLADVSAEVHDHCGPLRRLAARASHQMTEPEEHLAAELSLTGSSAWGRLHADVTSQLSTEVELPDGVHTLPMPAVRGLATDPQSAVRRAAYEAELRAWPTVAVPVAAAMNAIKGEAIVVEPASRLGFPGGCVALREQREPPDVRGDAVGGHVVVARHASLDANQGGAPRQPARAGSALVGSRRSPAVGGDDGVVGRGSRRRARRHSATTAPTSAVWSTGHSTKRGSTLNPGTARPVARSAARFVDDRSLVLLNWSGSADSTQTTAHELGHAYHNTTLAGRTALQRQLPMALAETASIFCETLVVEAGLARLEGTERLAQLDVDLVGTNQVIVDIRSRFLFETRAVPTAVSGERSVRRSCAR